MIYIEFRTMFTTAPWKWTFLFSASFFSLKICMSTLFSPTFLKYQGVITSWVISLKTSNENLILTYYPVYWMFQSFQSLRNRHKSAAIMDKSHTNQSINVSTYILWHQHYHILWCHQFLWDLIIRQLEDPWSIQVLYIRTDIYFIYVYKR